MKSAVALRLSDLKHSRIIQTLAYCALCRSDHCLTFYDHICKKSTLYHAKVHVQL